VPTAGSPYKREIHVVRPLVIMLMAVAVAATGCSSPEAAAPLPSATPVPPVVQPEPPAAVTVSPVFEAISIDDDDLMTKRTPRLAMDQAAIASTARAVVALLAADLDERNLGGEGRLVGLAADLIAVNGEAGALLASLAGQDNPATALDMVVRLGVDGTPRWAQANLDVTHADGQHTVLSLVLALDEETWRVLVVGTDTGVPA
jgi:hypothetical protein